MSRPMFAEQFRQQLALGKYTKWAEELSEEQLRCLLSMVGEFTCRSQPVLELLYQHHQGSSRGVIALEALSRMANYGERFDVTAWAHRITRGRGWLEYGDVPEALRAALDRVAPQVKWKDVLMIEERYLTWGDDPAGKSVSAWLGNDGSVTISRLIEEAAVPAVVRAAVKRHMPAFELHYINSLGPDLQAIDAYEFAVSDPQRRHHKLVVDADGKMAAPGVEK